MKIVAVIWRYILVRQFVLEHTLMNKLTGFLLFLLPLSLPFAEIEYSAGIVCAVAFLAAIQELKGVVLMPITGEREYDHSEWKTGMRRNSCAGD